MSRVKAGWEAYRQSHVSPEDDVERARRAFYAGAGMILGVMTNEVSSSPEGPTEEDMELIEGISVEMAEFVEEMSR